MPRKRKPAIIYACVLTVERRPLTDAEDALLTALATVLVQHKARIGGIGDGPWISTRRGRFMDRFHLSETEPTPNSPYRYVRVEVPR